MNKKFLAGILSCTVMSGYAIQQTEKKPNIILIMADDLGWGDVGFNGSKIVHTPNLDALSHEGVTMDCFYSAAPVSSPTRASVLTGRNPFRTGVFFANVGILRPEETTIPEILKTEGYTSGHFGKWHLGTLTDKIKDANRGGSKHPELLNPPALHGYDDAFVTESKVPTFDPMIKPVKNNFRFWDNIKDNENSLLYNTAYWDINGKRVTDNLKGDDSRIIMDRVIPFIDNAVSNNKPFMSVVWFHAPHLPCVAGPEHRALYSNMAVDKRNYYGCITALDEQVGRLVTYLKNIGEYDNTLIFFCSDNGPEENTPGSASYFKERKRSLHEGGIRVPAFAVWKNKIPSNVHISTPCVTCDYLPTIASLFNIKPDHHLDGENIMPYLINKQQKRDKPIVFCSDNQAVITNGEYKLYYKNGNYELYKISEDLKESKNIISENPKIFKELKKELMSTYGDYKKSFECKEYDKTSYDKLKQDWKDVFEIKQNKKK